MHRSSWISASAITLVFAASSGQHSGVQTGDSFSVNSGLIRAKCIKGTICSQNYVLQVAKKRILSATSSSVFTITVDPPEVSLVPIVILNLPTQSGACNNLTVDISASTGSGGRSWTDVTWNVLATDGDVTLEPYLNLNFNYVSNVMSVPRSMLYSTTYQITATVTNFLGYTSSGTATTTISSKTQYNTI